MPSSIAAAAPDQEFFDVQQALAGQYSLERELGRGGMGVVFLAREVELERLVAVKVLPPALAARAGVRDRFLREARTAARLSHPHIVPIHRVGEAGAYVYFAMAYVDGETLGQRLRARGRLAPEETSRVLREAAWALAYAHAQGVVHRDVKPDNILLERDTGRVLVSDFGIAQVQDAAAATLTDPGAVMGTAHYMSPEQAAAEPVDGRSDLYALGVIGYLATAGELPIDGPTSAVVLSRQLSETPRPLAQRAPHAPAALVNAIERCLAKAPDARFASGEALADALAPGLVRRADLPLPLRAWAQARDPMQPFYLAWGATLGTSFLVQLFLTSPTRFNGDLLAVASLSLVPLVAFELRQAGRILGHGYALADIRLAISEARARRSEELAAELDERPPLPIRALRWLGWSGVASIAALTVLGLSLGGPALKSVVTAISAVLMIEEGTLLGSLVFGSAGSLLLANALGAPLFGRTLKLRTAGRVRQWLWNSKVGEWAARLLGRAGKGSPAALVQRPTEMALGLAAADLFAALPRELRAQLAEVPVVVRQLEQRAVEARARVDELQQLLRDAEGELAASAARKGAASDAELLAARTATVRQLTEARDLGRTELSRTVAALERIRLDLLRLTAGSARSSDATTVLEGARVAAEDIARLAEARAEAERAARPAAALGAPTSMPTPTPA